MKFIKVKAIGQAVNGNEKESYEKVFFLNSSLIKLISSDGKVFLFDNGCDSRDNFLWNDHEKFSNIQVYDKLILEKDITKQLVKNKN